VNLQQKSLRNGVSKALLNQYVIMTSGIAEQYADDNITRGEIDSIIRKLEVFPASDLYESNKAIIKLVSDGFLLKREDRSQKDLYIQLIDYRELAAFRTPREPGQVCS
jgi:type I restriction enzyme R subunit